MTYHTSVCYVEIIERTGYAWGYRASDGIVVNFELSQSLGVLKARGQRSRKIVVLEIHLLSHVRNDVNLICKDHY